MKTKLALLFILALSELSLDGGAWISKHLTLQQLVAALAGPSISAGDRNGLRPH